MRLVRWIEGRPTLSENQLLAARLIWAVAGLYVFRVLVREGYLVSRSGAFFNLPIVPGLPPFPSWVQELAVLTVLPASLLILWRRFAGTGALLVALCLVAVTLGDYFGFRHLWVFLANIYLLLAAVFWTHVERDAHRSLSARYAVFTFRSFVALFYLIVALPKINSGFLRGLVIDDLVSAWGAGSWVADVIGHIPHAFVLMAVATIILELFLAFALVTPRFQSIGILTGLGFHVVIPVLGRVAPDLNFFVVATYVIFPVPEGRRMTVLRTTLLGFYIGLWVYYLLPIEPWPWVSFPAIAGISMLALAWGLLRRSRLTAVRW